MKLKIKHMSAVFASVIVTICSSLGIFGNVFADSFGVSPMNEDIVLTPGDTYYGSFTVSNPASSDADFTFKTTVGPFTSKNNTSDVKYETNENYNLITDWITILDGSGTISPNNHQIVHYVINVPNNAPAGGQYAAIFVQSAPDESANGSLNIQEQFRIAYLIYANVAGETIHDGVIESAEVPSFLLSGNIEGSSLVTNNGNTHVSATYTLQIFPLFSDEEVYTNEEDPDATLIMPGATRLNTTTWDNTPAVGIFNVKYSVEFEGETTTVEKMVIKCPIWLLFIIILAIVLIIFWLVMKARGRKKTSKR